MDNLLRMLQLQERLQTETYGHNFQSMTAQDRIKYIKEMKLALESELQEALDETTWKPWVVRSFRINREAYLAELVDVLHFFMNMLLVLGDSPEELVTEIFGIYCHKNKINERRQTESYDGTSTKCGACGRALDDPAVNCRRNGDQGFCADRNADINYLTDGAALQTRRPSEQLKPIKPVICIYCNSDINEYSCVPATNDKWGHCGLDQRQLPPLSRA